MTKTKGQKQLKPSEESKKAEDSEQEPLKDNQAGEKVEKEITPSIEYHDGDDNESADEPDEVVDNIKSFSSMSESFLNGKKSSKKKSGGFQSMGLSYPLLKGILKKGYKVPTPIQRKAIPVIMEGKDVVAMARTGSGKTGAFLIPMLEKLRVKKSTVGARALIFSPTRELAMQTLKFTKEIGKFMGLKSLLVLGGEKIEEQFAGIHEKPDIIIATPGRFLHLVIEMDLKLKTIEYVVFDEADRLFEMGFQEQIQEVLNRLPDHRQTLMFSATLPRLLVDFVKAGLSDPVLIRLDLEMKLSENLKTIYLCCRPHDKTAILLYLLKNVIDLSKELTVVFLATKHHIEYMKDVLEMASIPCSYIYSSLDQAARKINVAKFRSRKVGVLLVTDIAARGIDIPLLDNVINYNFPFKPKLFVHRVGRVARAGRSGTAYSLVAPDEMPYLIDLHLFLGKPLTFPEDGSSEKDAVCGSVPQSLIDDETDVLRNYHEASLDLQNMTRVCDNAYKQYVKSRPAPSSESVKRVKQMPTYTNRIHPLFHGKGSLEVERSKFLAGMRNYRPNTTIFELGVTGKSSASAIMREKRLHHSVIDRIRSMDTQKSEDSTHSNQNSIHSPTETLPAASENEIQAAFSISSAKQAKKRKANSEKKDFRDAEHYLPYMSSEHYSEMGLSVQSSFEQDASKAVLDLTADDNELNKRMRNNSRWDRKKKKFVKDDGSELKKKMKTESGVWIPKSFKSDLYEKWRSKYKVSFQEDQDDNTDEHVVKGKKNKFSKSSAVGPGKFKKSSHLKVPLEKNKGGKPKSELKSKEQILKYRKRRDKKMAHQKRRQIQKSKRKATRPRN